MGASWSGLSAISVLTARASKERILPLMEDPGMRGRLVRGSLITGLSVAPIAANALLAPICKPVKTSILPLILILRSVDISLYLPQI